MSTTSKKERHDAHDELAPLARLLAPFLVPLVAREIVRLGAVAPTERPYSQLDGERPVGCKRSKFLRVWALARDAGHPGATEHGRARLLTREAFERFATTSTRAPKAPPSEARPVDPDARALALLGLAPRRTA